MPLSDIGLAVLPEIEEYAPPRQYYVSHYWLEDSDLFNEWMNEEDYEMRMVSVESKLTLVFYHIFARLNRDIGLKSLRLMV